MFGIDTSTISAPIDFKSEMRFSNNVFMSSEILTSENSLIMPTRNFLPSPRIGSSGAVHVKPFVLLVESLASWPAMADSINAASSTVRVIGPGVSRLDANATQPQREHRPYVGFIPTMPVMAAGNRIEPPVSVPVAAIASPDATADVEPPDEPPAVNWRSICHGLIGAPKKDVLLNVPMANSSRLALPNKTVPASINFWETVDSYSGTKFSSMRDAAVVRMPRVANKSFIAIGAPSRGRALPALRRASDAAASANARSGVVVI